MPAAAVAIGATVAPRIETVTVCVVKHLIMAPVDGPMQKIAQYPGHTSTRVTETVYARYSPSYVRNASAALDW